MSETDELRLAAEFPAADRADWRALVDAVLRGRSFDDQLVSTLPGGIEVQPLYVDEGVRIDTGFPGSTPFLRGFTPAGLAASGWDIRQRVLLDTGETANAEVLDALRRGATSIELVVPPGPPIELEKALSGVLHDAATVSLRTADDGVAAARALVEVLHAADARPSAVTAELGCDPLTARLRGQPVRVDDAAALAAEVDGELPLVRAMTASGVAVAEAGATSAQQLATVLASGAEALVAMLDAGMAIDQAIDQLVLHVALDTDQFVGIALLRALRTCWSQLVDGFGAAEADRVVPAVASLSTSVLTRYDPWVNILRSTVGCFSAAVGGADTIILPPYDAAGDSGADLGVRLARNTQLILMEESNLHRVIDPAGGSWYVEGLTEALAASAWSIFQAIEGQGGLTAAIDNGWLAAKVESAWAERYDDLADRSTPIIGVSDFATLDEGPVGVAPADGGPFPRRRLAAPYEALRDAARAAPSMPTVFLANLGSPAVHTPRAAWATNLFAAGGIEAIPNEGFDGAEAVADAFRNSGASIAVVCSDDATYVDEVASVTPALRAAGCTRVYLAGHPGERRAEYDDAGVDRYLHVGCDVVASLHDAHDALGLRQEVGR